MSDVLAHPLVILFLVHQGEAGAPATTAMLAATEKALGAGASVLVREAEPFPADDAVAGEADVVAEVTWTTKPVSAHLHVHTKPGWLDRDIGFATTDSATDRGRTVGFVVAAMVPEFEPTPLPAPPPPPPPFVPVVSTVSPERPPDVSPKGPRPSARFVVDAFGALGSAMGTGVGVGGGGAFGVQPSPWIGVGVRSDLRVGELVGFGRTTAFRVGAGVALSTHVAAPFALALRLDVAALRVAVTRTGVAGATTSGDSLSRWVPDVTLVGEVVGRLGGDAALYGAVGPEVALGTTKITLNGAEVGGLPRVRVSAAVGLRVRF